MVGLLFTIEARADIKELNWAEIDCKKEDFMQSVQSHNTLFENSTQSVLIGVCTRLNGSHDLLILDAETLKELDRLDIGGGFPLPKIAFSSMTDDGKVMGFTIDFMRVHTRNPSPALVRGGLLKTNEVIVVDFSGSSILMIFMRSQDWNVYTIH